MRVLSQEAGINNTVQIIAEELAANESEPENLSLFIELLNELSDDPVRINSADETELQRLFFLSDFQVKALADHISSTGHIISFQELALIPGFDKQTAEMMIPFITLETLSVNKLTPGRLHYSLIANTIFNPGERDTSMPGSGIKVLTKHKMTYGNFTAGLTTEKDKGEKFLAPDGLPDFLSGYLAYSGNGIIKEVIAGDFSARTGMGTTINTGMRTGLSLTTTGSWGGSDDIKPYTSANENNFFRGAAMRLGIKNGGAMLFFSRNRIDAALNLSADSQLYAESLYQSGLHNSALLIDRKDVLENMSLGLNLRYDIKRFRIGLTWTQNRFSIPLELNRKGPENFFSFSGKRNDLLSACYRTQVKNILMYGEFSSDPDLNTAFIQGFSVRPSDRLSVNMFYRKYDPGFSSFHGSGPGSRTSTSNETGMTGSFVFEAAGHLFISGGFDLSKHDWLRYRISFPSVSKKAELRIKFDPAENTGFDFSVTFRESMLDDDALTGIPGISYNKYVLFKGLFRYLPSENLTLSSRVAAKYVRNDGSRGYLLSQDLIYVFRTLPLTIWARYCIYNSQSWDSRLYLYENDLLYSFSVPAFSGDGNRSYLMLKYVFRKSAEIRIKYGVTSLSGNSESADELKFQLKLWF